MNIGAIVTTVARIRDAITAVTSLINQSRNIANQERSHALMLKGDSDNLQLGMKRTEFDAKMEMMRQAVRAKERQEEKEFSLQLKAIETENLFKLEGQRQAFQSLEAEKQREFTQSIEKFKAEVQIVLQADNIAFQRWKTETDRQFTLELRALDAQIMRLRDKQNREDARRDRNSPVFSVADDILKTVTNNSEMPLTVFFSSPVLRYDPIPNATTNSQFPMMESTVSGALREMFKQYTLKQRPIKFMAGEWGTKNRRAESAVNQIYRDLYSIPVIVLETEVEESYFNINIGFWNNDFNDVRFETVVRKYRWQDAIAQICQELAQKWQQQGRQLQTNYDKAQFSRRSRETFTQYMEVLHCIHTGMVADEYFLIYAPQRQLPLLPSLLQDLFEEANLSQQESEALEKAVIDYCNALFSALEATEPALMVELRIGWAKILQQLPSQYGFAEQVQALMKTWLKQRGITNSIEPLTEISKMLLPEDTDFVQSLNGFLQVLGETRYLNIAQSCFQRGVEHIQAQRYDYARTDFDRTISLNPHVEAYHQRAIAHYGLENYQNAIADLDKAIALQPHRAELYDLRGDVYHKLGNYELALANYNQAVSLGHSSNKRDNLQQQWNDTLRHEQEERKRKEAEAARKRKEEEDRRRALILPLPNNQTLKLVWIPKGTLKMEGGHTINLSEFRMGKYPVTQAQYQAVMGNNPSHFRTSPNHPVENVNWFQANEFCKKLTEYLKKQGFNVKIDLPSETQWEYACRAGTTTKYWFGNNENELKKHAWYKNNSGDTTHSVKEAEDTHTNPWGLVDMHGNVWEWCKDEWTSNVNQLPTDSSTYKPNSNNNQICSLRGGSWLYDSNSCASGDRYYYNARVVHYYFGFRIVCV
ncbi:SUMF1/EgtB/PvdO family nonheme iron enzyme [Geminocystis sp. GBBB08]|uniref:SUMF1/EgtB/PvdO family nonheme iron enzyme n=1 Tax=Geminocystis sp. GBBB08 TaxID=2604140 RepID=UPI0027E38D16|nr:SUMF1/EgtB/PvdO family nonheme iron enzyme [Geminocystis sp. GBBB08]MBL1208164.1 SUMF1/EgtB/PvdO family nonheme iron enzyme [Geminocystis sp. GBBB08]